jgi:hypothetical protein
MMLRFATEEQKPWLRIADAERLSQLIGGVSFIDGAA